MEYLAYNFWTVLHNVDPSKNLDRTSFEALVSDKAYFFHLTSFL